MKMIIDKEKIYQHLPIPFQNLAVSIEGLRLKRRRYDDLYQEFHSRVVSRNFKSEDELLHFQAKRLREQFLWASRSPYWQQRFSDYGVKINSQYSLDELAKLPILTKEEVKSRVSEIIIKERVGEKQISCHTSGTTGSGLIFPMTLTAEKEQWAVWWRYRLLHGIDFQTWCGYFGGRSLVPLSQTKEPYWRVNYWGRQLMFSAYHLKPETVPAYVRALKNNKIQWLHGYPSVLAMLAGIILDQGLSVPDIRVVTTGAESLLPHQRDIISRAFGAQVFQHYGQAEGVANFSECKLGCMHVDEDYSIVELIPVSDQDDLCCIVGSSLSNKSFPLFRYDTGDLATISSERCSCGRLGRMVEDVDGRREDYILLPNGARVGRLDHIFKDLTRIREAQIYQNNQGAVLFRVVKGRGYDESGEERRMIEEARRRLGSEIDIDVEYLNQIPRTKAGKLRFVLSDLKNMRIAADHEPNTSKPENR